MIAPASGKRRIRGGSLVLISVMLLGSGLLRLGVEAGPAISREMGHSTMVEDPHSEKLATGSVEVEDLQPILAAFQQREQEIEAQEAQITDRLKALSIAESAIDKKLAEMIRVEKQLRATIALADGAAESDLTRLTDVYEKMKPKNAAALFEQMDPKFAAGFLARMRPDAAANVLAGLDPKAAYAISLIFAGRNADVPKN